MSTATSTTKLTSIPSPDSADYAETRSVQLEWKVSNLRQLFDSTKGEVKSKCVKSSLFDQGRWQIFLYPNSGQEQYVSVYLSAEPTPAERERGLAEQATSAAQASGAGGNGGGKEKVPWRRDGHYKFTFEIRSLDRRVTYKTMEPDDNHQFNSSYRNWGYAQMISRRDAYYNNAAARAADAFLIICTIVSTPTLPTSPPPTTHVSIPKTLVSAYASLFDDPDYSDVVFRIRPDGKGRGGKRVKEKRLFAAKKILAGRSEYFEMMFSSGFSEGSLPSPRTNTNTNTNPTATSSSTSRPRSSSARRPRPSSTLTAELDDEGELTASSASEGEGESDGEGGSDSESGETDLGWDEDEDSDPEEEEEADKSDEEEEEREGKGKGEREYVDGPEDAQQRKEGGTPKVAFPSSSWPSSSSSAHQAPASPDLARTRRSRTSSASLTDTDDESATTAAEGGDASVEEGNGHASTPPALSSANSTSTSDAGAAGFVDALSAPTSPVKPSTSRGGGEAEGGRRKTNGGKSGKAKEKREKKRSGKTSGSKRRAHGAGDGRARFEVVVTDAAWSTYRSLLYYLYTDSITFSPLASTYYSAREAASSSGQPFPYSSRREYLLAQSGATGGEGAGGEKVGPASSKAIYRLADKMDLKELKERAYEHVVKSLTAENIVYEVFGSFSQRFDEIRQVEIAFLLQHWNTVRTSPQMRLVFDYLRTGRFPGFEDVWIELVQCLEVRAGPTLPLSVAGGAGGGQGGGGGGGRMVQGGAGEGEGE